MTSRAIDAAQRFFPASEITSLQPLSGGHIQQTFVLATVSGRWVLQRINRQVFPDVAALMQNIVRVSRHLRSGSLINLEVLLADDGQWYAQDAEGECWRMLVFIEQTRTFESVPEPEKVRAAARAFGHFATALRDLPSPRLHEVIPGFHATERRFEALQEAARMDRHGRAAQASRELALISKREPLATELARRGLPERVVHNDAKLGNVLFDAVTDEAVSVVDWDTVMPGLIAHDFGDMVRSMSTDAAEDEIDLAKVRVREDLFEALADGYLSGTAQWLSAAEREALLLGGKTIIFEQALRFLTDFLQGDVYYPVKKPQHNLDRCRTQLALLASLEQSEGALQKVIAACVARHSGRSDFHGSSCE